MKQKTPVTDGWHYLILKPRHILPEPQSPYQNTSGNISFMSHHCGKPQDNIQIDLEQEPDKT